MAFLRPKPESKSGSMKMFLCLLQKCVSLILSKSDQKITSDIFSAKLSNSPSVPKDAEILGLFTRKSRIGTHRRWALLKWAVWFEQNSSAAVNSRVLLFLMKEPSFFTHEKFPIGQDWVLSKWPSFRNWHEFEEK